MAEFKTPKNLLSTGIYRLKQKRYHKELVAFIKNNYDIEATKLLNTSWGYNTTFFYIESSKGNFGLKMAEESEEIRKSKLLDIEVSKFLTNKLSVETSTYYENKDGKILLDFKDKIVILTKFIEGDMPFNLSEDIFIKAINILDEIHKQDYTPLETLGQIKLDKLPAQKHVLLHGDPTPSNFLVAHNKIVAVLDFEMAKLGPVEWDIAKCIVFFWFRMDKELRELVDLAIESYSGDINPILLDNYVLKHTHNHYENIVANRNKYQSTSKWVDDERFAKNRLDMVKIYLKTREIEA